ncbi:uncharacterized protein [Rutidosis leptorrhynchoides]|uniref:uncharacterized protein n=1 Tax=Rutidosis leptorrhynchoides TaxID=125765 RepID=UPI003A99A86D
MADNDGWFKRPDVCDYDYHDVYDTYKELFAINVHHHGQFICNPKRQYVGGMLNPFDFVECFTFSMDNLNAIIKEIGFSGGEAMYYHFRIPCIDLDNGLCPLVTEHEHDVVKMLSYIPKYQCIDVYVEHGFTCIGRGSLIDEIDIEFAISETVSKGLKLCEDGSEDGSEDDG